MRQAAPQRRLPILQSRTLGDYLLLLLVNVVDNSLRFLGTAVQDDIQGLDIDVMVPSSRIYLRRDNGWRFFSSGQLGTKDDGGNIDGRRERAGRR